MELPPMFTRKTLAEYCDLNLRTLDRHIEANTLKIGDAVEKIPGLGIRISGPKAKRFVQAMYAKRSQLPPA